jgi:hydroxypyruvate isomerase
MVTLSVCLETLFTDLPVEERIGRIKEAGYDAVEFWHPEGTWDGSGVNFDLAKDPAAVRRACDERGVVLNDFALHAWDGSIGGCPVRSEDHGRYLGQVDHAGYYLDSTAEAVAIVRAVNSPHLRILYDVYHMQIMEGNVIATIEKNIEWIGHFHSAGVPGRAEHFGGELDYPVILRRIEATGYEGAFGLEYFPKMADHLESLKRVRAYLCGA